MTLSEKQSWEHVRAKGRDHFILRDGVLRRGLPFGVFMTVAMLLITILTHKPIEPVWKVGVMFAFYTLGFGAAMGGMTWSDREKDYQKPTDDDDVV